LKKNKEKISLLFLEKEPVDTKKKKKRFLSIEIFIERNR